MIKKKINMYLKLEIRVVCREFLVFKSVFFKTNQMIIYICTLEILKTRVKTGFSVHIVHLLAGKE